ASGEPASAPPASRQIIPPFRLLVAAGPDRGLERASTAASFGIGTASVNQLVLRDPAVSPQHCALAATSRGFLLRDLGSPNGTWLGGYRVESAYVSSEATIRVGETTLRFDVLDHSERDPPGGATRWGPLLGSSLSMRRLFALLPRIASSPVTLLLEGETGTGKGLLAESIHKASPRAGGPLVVVDCSAIPPTLIEAELFGHEKGAFTGAHTARPGAFQAAHGGTLFLDEIGELPLELQPKFLRALEERQVKRIG